MSWNFNNSVSGSYSGNSKSISGGSMFAPSYTTASTSTTITPMVSHGTSGGAHAFGGGISVSHPVSSTTSISAGIRMDPGSSAPTASVGISKKM